MKKLLTVCLCAVMLCGIFLFSGCAQDDDNTLVLGLDASFAPMGFKDENNEIVGFDIDVAREVCERIGMTLECKEIIWDQNLSELNNKSIDCVWNGMSINEEREASMLLTPAYMNNRMVFAVKTDSDIQTVDQLTGKKIAVQNGSEGEKALDASGIQYEKVGHADYAMAYNELGLGLVDAVLVDEVAVQYMIKSQGKDFRILDEALGDDLYVIGFRKEDTELKDKVWNAIKEMKEDGTLKEISEKWFGSDLTVVE